MTIVGPIMHVPEGRRVVASLTVIENLELGSYRRAARAGRAEALETVLELFEHRVGPDRSRGLL